MEQVLTVLKSVPNLVFFIFRIIIPILSLLVILRCYASMRAGRRREEPVVFLEDAASGVMIPVLYWENSIGRSKSCDIRIPDDTISRDHAVLMRRESGWTIVDTESKSGTFLNGKKIKGSMSVRPGDTIKVGATSLVLKRVTDVKPQARPGRHQQAKTPSPAGLLLTTTLIQALLFSQACYGSGELSLLPVLPFVVLLIVEWGLYFYSRRILSRVSFEIETIGFLLSGIGLALLSGQRLELDEGQALPSATTLFHWASMKVTYTQMITMIMGVVLFCVMVWFMKDLERTTKWRIPVTVAAVGLLALNLLLAHSTYGSKNWISIGGASIQPSEFVKLAFIFAGAATLDRLQTKRNLAGFIGFSAICMGALFLMKDLGTAVIFFVTFLIISFMRSGSVRTVALAISAAGLGGLLVLQMMPHVASRFDGWRHVWEDTQNVGYQQSRGMSYGAGGGLFGLGIGNGGMGAGTGPMTGKSNMLFAANSDLVFDMVCEELGIVLAIVILIGLVLLAFYVHGDVSRSRSTFYSISSCAAAGMLLFQTMLNVFGSTDVLPFTGVTLPFISAGGSSMISCWGMLAFLKASDERTYAGRRRGSVPISRPIREEPEYRPRRVVRGDGE